MKNQHKNFILAAFVIILVATVFMAPAEAIVSWHAEEAANGKHYPRELGYDLEGNPGFVQMIDGRSAQLDMEYRYKSPTGWVSKTVASAFGKPGLAFDKLGQPHILYVSGTSGDMELIYSSPNSAGEWIGTTIKTASYINYDVSLKFNSKGYPCIAYIIYDTLYYAEYDGTTWKEQSICYNQELSYANLAFNGTAPAIAFTAREHVKYAYLSGSKWVIETVDTAPTEGYRNRHWYINLDFGSGTPLISYFDQVTSNVKFAYFMEGKWNTTILEKSAAYANPVMQVHNQESGYVVYIAYTNYVRFANTSIKLKTLAVNSNSPPNELNFSTQTMFSKNIDMPPSLALGLYNGRPGIAVSDYWGNKTFYISMQPKIQTVPSLVFGAVEPSVMTSQTITITNHGSIDLSISGISASGTAFSLAQGSAGLLASGQSTTATVAFEPTQPGKSYEGSLTIQSNDPDRPVLNIPLSGRSIGASADLSNLVFDNGVNLPIVSDKTTYDLEVAHATEGIRVKPVATHAYTSIEVTGAAVKHDTFSGEIGLSIGSNVITILVTSEDGKTTKSYTLEVTRRDSPDASLSTLSVSHGELSPAFSPEIRTYTLTLPDGISTLEVGPEASQTGSTMEISQHMGEEEKELIDAGDKGTYQLLPKVGSNIYTIHVLAPDNETPMDYEITILHLPELTGISLDQGTLNLGFDPYIQTYSTVVPRSTHDIRITPTIPHGCSVSINGEDASYPVALQVGNNTVTVNVFSPDNKTSREYILTVNRLEGLHGLSVGETQVMLSWEGWNNYDLDVEITEADVPIFFSVPEGMSVKVNDEFLTGGGISKNFHFSEGKNTPINIELISPECEETTVYTLTVTRRPLLKSLTIAGEMVPLYNNETFYIKTIPYNTTEVDILAETNHGTKVLLEGNISALGGSGNWLVDNLRFGRNHLYLILSSEDEESETTYSVVLQRPTVLSNLSVNKGALIPDFAPDIYHYTVTLGEDIGAITVSAIVNEDEIPGTMVSVDSRPSYSNADEEMIALSDGSNLIPITISLGGYVNTIYYVDAVRMGPLVDVVFMDNGLKRETKTVNAGQSLGAKWPFNPILTGYVFDGWYTEEEGTGTLFTSDTIVRESTIVYAKWSAGPPSSGGNADTGSTRPGPTHQAHVVGGDTLPISLDMGIGHGSINLDSMAGNLGTGESTVIDVPFLEGINSYTANLPSSAISGTMTGQLTLNTNFASITLPENMLSGTGFVGHAGITFGRVDRSDLPEAVKQSIGNHPIIRLALSIDGKQVDWNNPGAAVKVSIPYQPTAEELKNPDSIVIWYIDGSGNIVNVPNGSYDAISGRVTFQTTHFSMYSVSYNSVNFKDVPQDKWHYKAINYIAARGITSGTGNGMYGPESKLTRGNFLVLLMKAYGIVPDTNPVKNFSDAGNTYYSEYLATAKRLGISSGVGNNQYAPDKEISRQEMFTLLYNTLQAIKQLPQGDSGKTLSSFADGHHIDPWAKEALSLLVKTGTIEGSDGKLTPMGTTSRAEMAQVLYNLLKK